ncbi:MAG: hypothetical protein ACYC3S_04090 [Chloroflexota bacterium]
MDLQRLAWLAGFCTATLMVAGCQSGVGPPTAAPTLSPAAVAPSAVATAVPTVVVLPPPTASSAGETTSAGPVPTATAGVVTVDASGVTLTLAVGQVFRLNLPSFYVWRVQVGDPAVLTPIGADQYEALAAGETIMLLDGDPVCRKTSPPCGAPSVRRTLQVTVR